MLYVKFVWNWLSGSGTEDGENQKSVQDQYADNDNRKFSIRKKTYLSLQPEKMNKKPSIIMNWRQNVASKLLHTTRDKVYAK